MKKTTRKMISMVMLFVLFLQLSTSVFATANEITLMLLPLTR